MIISLFENLVYNNSCKVCGESFYFKNQNIICESCLTQIKKEKLIYCKSCGKKTDKCIECLKYRKYDEIEIFTTYSFIFQEVIKYYKFRNFKNLSKEIANLIKEDISEFLEKKNINFILYIPSSIIKEKERGFNHLFEILINCVPKILIRDDLIKIKETHLQVGLPKEKRQINLKDSFELRNRSLYKDKNVLIFDDILTTGSTLLEAYKVVKASNPKNIYAYVIAT